MSTRERLADALRQTDADLRHTTVLSWNLIGPTDRARWMRMADAAAHFLLGEMEAAAARKVAELAIEWPVVERGGA